MATPDFPQPNIRELARHWFESVWNERSSDAIFRLAAPTCLGHHEGEVTTGPADLKLMRDRLVSMLPDLRVVIEDIVADADDAVVRWRFRGAHTGAGGSFAPTGRAVEFSGMTWLKFRDGQIVEGWDSWNQAALLQQLQTPA